MSILEQKGMYPEFPRCGKPHARTTHYCPGCGHGIVNKLIAEACAEMGLQDDTIWLSQKLMATLFDCSTDNIGLHLKNIYNEGELDEKSTTELFSVVATNGKTYNTKHYNLDAIIAVGYRVNSKKATAFRRWATSILRDYAIRG